MKAILIFACLLLCFTGCKKEDFSQGRVNLENVFEIKADSDDPIQKRIYAIYKTYGVPVFFNDTIGQVYIMDDVKGQPIYQVEKIDLAWTFNGYSKQVYQFAYMNDPEKQSQALDIVEAYLADVGPSLRPFSFFITQSARKLDQGSLIQEYKDGAYLIGFRTVFMTGDWTPTQQEKQPALMKRSMVLDKITNYPQEIAEFSAVTKPAHYGNFILAYP